jgi:hypothetical protein
MLWHDKLECLLLTKSRANYEKFSFATLGFFVVLSLHDKLDCLPLTNSFTFFKKLSLTTLRFFVFVLMLRDDKLESMTVITSVSQ